MGCVMREWSDEVRLGMMRLLSAWSRWSRVPGRPSRSPVRGLWKEEWVFSEGAILTLTPAGLISKLPPAWIGVTASPLFVWGPVIWRNLSSRNSLVTRRVDHKRLRVGK